MQVMLVINKKKMYVKLVTNLYGHNKRIWYVLYDKVSVERNFI